MAFYNIVSDSEFSGVTVTFADGTSHVVGSDNKDYSKLIQGLVDGSLSDEDILNLVSPFEAIYKTLTRLSERVSRKGLKLLFDGDPVHNALTKHIVKIMDGGGSEEEWGAYVKFWEKAATNPSQTSQDELFLFIEQHGLLLTPEGDVVFYKGTQADGRSTRAGYGIVNGVEFQNDYLLNEPGTIVEIPRSMVDDNRGVACSVGLHVGAFSYASTFGGGKLFTVIVNPRDVVSVPFDHNDSKVRVTRYVVAEENDGRVQYDGTLKVFDLVEPETPEEPVSTPQPYVPVQSKAATPVPGNGSRVDEYTLLIQTGGAGKNLRRFRNRSVTPGRRTEFDQAVQNLGLQY